VWKERFKELSAILTSYNDHMKTISATKFKAHCLQLMKEVRDTGQTVIVTNRGKPLAQIGPVAGDAAPRFEIGKFEGMAKVVGDIISPLDIEWDALK
jgi:prevent-host-death family protein